MEKVYNLKNDIIFKAFFSRKGNEEYLKDFLGALLGIEIETIKIKEEVSLEQLSTVEKGGRLDLQATLNERQIVNIELQFKNDFKRSCKRNRLQRCRKNYSNKYIRIRNVSSV